MGQSQGRLGWVTGVAAVLLVLSAGVRAADSPGPRYDFSRQELEAILDDLIAWLPGSWDSYPQVHFQRRVRAPAGGEHAHWHRVFARIDAPQLGEVVFYGQINLGGRDAPMMHRSQILYTARIDEARGAVIVNGQGPADPERFENLHERPELWSEVRMRDPAALRCDFLWRREGTQIVGLLEAKAVEGRKAGLGTCSYRVDGTDVEFFADAEWVLGPENLWDYDINLMNGHQFVGRPDRLHKRLYRAAGYECRVRDAAGERKWFTHDRGGTQAVTDRTGRALRLMLLRAPMPNAEGHGMQDRLRLMVQRPNEDTPLQQSEHAPLANTASIEFEGVSASCERASSLPPMHAASTAKPAS
ncbi:MAG: hypothetical protein ACO3CV_03890 [Steroidobacteraceae bacterium]